MDSKEKLLDCIERLKNSKTKDVIDARIEEFRKNGKKTSTEIFKELCFCILTANFNAERTIKIQEQIDDGFLVLSKPQLAKKLKMLGYRFPNTRARYIVEARRHKDSLREIAKSFKKESELRNWLTENIKGIGYKEASHFLRNTGYTNFAILDFHIIDVLTKCKLIDKPKTLTKRKYFEIEDSLKIIADKTGLNLAELDLYLWCMETGKVLK